MLHPERFRRRDLNVVDVTRVPERFEDRVRESKHENVLRGLFSEKVIDPVDLILGKCVQHNLVQMLRGFEVRAERFFDNDARPASFTRFA